MIVKYCQTAFTSASNQTTSCRWRKWNRTHVNSGHLDNTTERSNIRLINLSIISHPMNLCAKYMQTHTYWTNARAPLLVVGRLGGTLYTNAKVTKLNVVWTIGESVIRLINRRRWAQTSAGKVWMRVLDSPLKSECYFSIQSQSTPEYEQGNCHTDCHHLALVYALEWPNRNAYRRILRVSTGNF